MPFLSAVRPDAPAAGPGGVNAIRTLMGALAPAPAVLIPVAPVWVQWVIVLDFVLLRGHGSFDYIGEILGGPFMTLGGCILEEPRLIDVVPDDEGIFPYQSYQVVLFSFHVTCFLNALSMKGIICAMTEAFRLNCSKRVGSSSFILVL